VALRTPDLSKKCSCKGNSKCKRCFDTGYLFTDELVRCYSWAQVLGVEFITKVGSISSQIKGFVIESKRELTKQSYILELDLDKATGKPIQPFTINKAYKIADFNLINARDNKPAFWIARGEEREFTNNTKPSDGTGFSHSVYK
jgi:hypothetical protein